MKQRPSVFKDIGSNAFDISTLEYSGEDVRGPFQYNQDFDDDLSTFDYQMPHLVRDTQYFSPLYDCDTQSKFLPHLIDAVSGVLTEDAWEWQTTQIIGNLDIHIEFNDISSIGKVLQGKEKRGYPMWEFFENEQNYTRQLWITHTVYYKKLQESQVISEINLNRVFDGILDLLQVHSEFYQKLESALQNWDNETTIIGNIILEFSSDMAQAYATYIDAFATSQKILKDLEEKEDQRFVTFLRSIMPQAKNIELKEYLIYPVQRVMRYSMFLKELLKYTPDEHPDKNDLKLAMIEMERMAAMVDDKKREQEEMTGLFEASYEIKNCPPILVSNKRRVIQTVTAACAKSNRLVKLYLCTDLLMIATQNGKTFDIISSKADKPYKFVRWLDLLDITIESCDLDKTLPSNSLRVAINPGFGRVLSDSGIAKDSPSTLIGTNLYFYFIGHDDNAGKKNRDEFLQNVEIVAKDNLKNHEERIQGHIDDFT